MPALIGTWHSDFVFEANGKEYAAAMHKQLNQQKSPVFYVLDLSHWDTMTFGELVAAANVGSRGKDPNFHHAMNRKTLIITTNTTVSAAAEGITDEMFGAVNAQVFASLKDALAYVTKNS